MRRRQFLASTSALTLASLAAVPWLEANTASADFSELDSIIAALMKKRHIPGVSACLVDKTNVLWSGAYGFAEIERQVPMTLDTVLNIASISKTITATAIMQLVEYGVLDLDRDINDYLPYSIRNPNFPNVPVTVRQLMIHTSSLRDAGTYSKKYECGDPKLSLTAWIREYFTSGGSFYDATDNFDNWAPGTKLEYANLPFGVLGVIVETVAGLPFEEYCQRSIFKHLGMNSTSWLLTGVDQTRHAVPYSWVENGKVRGRGWGGVALGIIRQDGLTSDKPLEDGYQANCLYNHPNIPDGFLRTSVNDLSIYARAYLNHGVFNDRRILKPETIDTMLTEQVRTKLGDEEVRFGLTWHTSVTSTGQLMWGHGGGDPGVGTYLALVPGRGIGAIVFTNTYTYASNAASKQIVTRTLEFAV